MRYNTERTLFQRRRAGLLTENRCLRTEVFGDCYFVTRRAINVYLVIVYSMTLAWSSSAMPGLRSAWHAPLQEPTAAL